MLPEVVERLRAHKREQSMLRLSYAGEWDDGDLACERGNGSPLNPDAMSQAFKRFAKRAGLDPATHLHNLRDGIGTQLARKSVHPHTVSAVLGHSTVAFTLDAYTHEWREAMRAAKSALGDGVRVQPGKSVGNEPSEAAGGTSPTA